MSVSETLYLAADYLQAHGWAQGKGWFGLQPGDPACAEGAIFTICGIGAAQPAIQAVADYVGCTGVGGERPRYLWRWNDTPGRTAAEVIEVLRSTARIEAARERETTEVTR